ncbi:MAG: hypothetical protein SGPRY_005267 [Prymnesium sp.]
MSFRSRALLFLVGLAVYFASFFIRNEIAADAPFLIELEQCVHKQASFAAASSYFLVYPLRPVIADEFYGTACPATYTEALPFNVSLEAEDGLGKSLRYAPVVFLANQGYAQLSIEVVDSAGAPVLPSVSFAIGPNLDYPWERDTSSAAAPPMPPFAPLSGNCGLCSNVCEYRSDGQCDDGGPSSLSSRCSLGDDCQDCGCRAAPARRLYEDKTLGTSALPLRNVRSEAETELFTPAPGSRRLLKGGTGSSGGSSGGSSLYAERLPIPIFSLPLHQPSIALASAHHRLAPARTTGVAGPSYTYAGAARLVDRIARPLTLSPSSRSFDYSGEARISRRDRYELDINFVTPEDGSAAWPLYVRINNFTTVSCHPLTILVDFCYEPCFWRRRFLLDIRSHPKLGCINFELHCRKRCIDLHAHRSVVVRANRTSCPEFELWHCAANRNRDAYSPGLRQWHYDTNGACGGNSGGPLARDEVRLAGRPHEEKMVSLCYVVWLESVSCFVRVGWVRPIWHA